MSGFAPYFLGLCGLIYAYAVLRLLIKKKINEFNTIYWLGAVFVIIILAAVPDVLDHIAIWIGIDYPPALLFLATSLVLLYISLKQAVQLTALDDKVRELAQMIAVQNQNRQSKD